MSIGTMAPNLFDRLALSWGRTFKARPPLPAELYAPTSSVSGPAYMTFPGWEALDARSSQSSQAERQARTALLSAWVTSDITAIANEASVADLVITQRNGADADTDIANHPLEVVWESPNPFFGRSLLVKSWIWQLLLSGEAYLLAVPDTSGTRIAEIWPLPSFMVTPLPDPAAFIGGYLFRSNPQAKAIKLDPHHVCYSRLPNPFDIRRGLSPLNAAMLAIESDLAMARWNRNFFAKDNAAPTGIIAVPKDTLDNDLVRIRQEIMEFFTGGGRRVGVARAGDLTWTPFDRSQKDMEFLSGRQFSRAEIDRVFGIPEGFWSKDATRANSEGAKATMIENAVWPQLVMLAEDLNAQWVGTWYGTDVRATFNDIRPRNRTLELDEFKTYSAVKTLDELRAMVGDKAIGDYRGLMLLAEIAKAAPMPTTPASMELEDSMAAMEADAAAAAPPPEDAPTDAAPTDPAAAPDAPLDATAPLKADDLRRWERKALKALKDGRAAAVAFAPDVLTDDEASSIRAALADVTDAAAVKAVFAAASTDALIDAELDAALAWAKQAQTDDH